MTKTKVIQDHEVPISLQTLYAALQAQVKGTDRFPPALTRIQFFVPVREDGMVVDLDLSEDSPVTARWRSESCVPDGYVLQYVKKRPAFEYDASRYDVVFAEDEACANDPTATRTADKWAEIFGVPRFDLSQIYIAEHDDGDGGAYLLPNGWVVEYSCDCTSRLMKPKDPS